MWAGWVECSLWFYTHHWARLQGGRLVQSSLLCSEEIAAGNEGILVVAGTRVPGVVNELILQGVDLLPVTTLDRACFDMQ